MMWTVETGAKFIQEIHPIAFVCGWNLHLGGGVLTRGFSDSDLDVLALPRFQTTLHDKQPLVVEMGRLGWLAIKIRELPNRDVRGFEREGRKVEFIFFEVK
jgi:hypothetical protein